MKITKEQLELLTKQDLISVVLKYDNALEKIKKTIEKEKKIVGIFN